MSPLPDELVGDPAGLSHRVAAHGRDEPHERREVTSQPLGCITGQHGEPREGHAAPVELDSHPDQSVLDGVLLPALRAGQLVTAYAA